MSRIVIEDGLVKLVRIELEQGEQFRTAYQQLRDYTAGIDVRTEWRSQWLSRLLTFEPLLWQILYAQQAGTAHLTTDSVGEVLPEVISADSEWCVDRESFIGADYSVEIERYEQRNTVGLFGGGMFFHHLKGQGNALVRVDGHLDKQYLKRGETLQFDPDYLLMFRPDTELKLLPVPGWSKVTTGKAFFLEAKGPAEFYLDRVVGEHTEHYGILRKLIGLVWDYVSPV